MEMTCTSHLSLKPTLFRLISNGTIYQEGLGGK